MAGNVEQSPLYFFSTTSTIPSRLVYSTKTPRNERVISTEELGTMSKNNLRGATLEIRPTVISSNTRCGRVLTFEEIGAVLFFKGRRVKEGGVYFPIKLLTSSGAKV